MCYVFSVIFPNLMPYLPRLNRNVRKFERRNLQPNFRTHHLNPKPKSKPHEIFDPISQPRPGARLKPKILPWFYDTVSSTFQPKP